MRHDRQRLQGPLLTLCGPRLALSLPPGVPTRALQCHDHKQTMGQALSPAFQSTTPCPPTNRFAQAHLVGQDRPFGQRRLQSKKHRGLAQLGRSSNFKLRHYRTFAPPAVSGETRPVILEAPLALFARVCLHHGNASQFSGHRDQSSKSCAHRPGFRHACQPQARIFRRQLGRFRRRDAAQPPDLIVHSGDVSFDGAGDEDDVAFARLQKDRLPAPWIAIPGNHDAGESPLAVRLGQPIDAERIARWQRHFGASRWCRDVGFWRLIGIDTALLGSGHPRSISKLVSGTELGGRSDRPVLLFQHLPPFENDPDDTSFTTMAVPAGPRKWLLDLCVRNGVAVIACGHLHVYRRMEYRGIEIVWAPATSFFNIVEKQRPWPWRAPRGICRMDSQGSRHQPSLSGATADDRA